MSAPPTPVRRGVDRPLYTWAAVLAAMIVFAGFARTFYLQGVFHGRALSLLLTVHGTLMTLWFTLFIVQARLVAAGRTDVHRRLGVFGGVLLGLILVVGALTAVDAARRGVTPTPEVTPLAFMAIPFADLFVFAVMIGAALWNRRRPAVHKRLMLLGTMAILAPGIARIPLGFIEKGGLPVIFGLVLLGVIVCIVIDTVRNRRLHPALGWGGAFVVLSVPLRILIAGSAAWMKFAAWIVG